MTPPASRPTIDAAGPTEGRFVEPRSPWYCLDLAESADQLDVDLQRGLSDVEADRRRELTGPNELVGEPKRPWWKRLLDQFRGVLILLLLGAAVISAAVGDFKDPIVIGVVVVINALLGFVQEQRADQAMEALSSMLTTQAQGTPGRLDRGDRLRRRGARGSGAAQVWRPDSRGRSLREGELVVGGREHPHR
jgi:Ca2+-transporting ATPase